MHGHRPAEWLRRYVSRCQFVAGTQYRSIGAFGRAMQAWDEAWRLAQDSPDAAGRAIADYAVSQWMDVAVSFDCRMTGMSFVEVATSD